MSLDRRSLGHIGEELAAQALIQRGYTIRERNWRTRGGEIDLVATEGEVLVFVEVKTRRSLAFGTPQEAVAPAKQARLRQAAELYLQTHQGSWTAVRFDVVAITLNGSGPHLEVIPNAFEG